MNVLSLFDGMSCGRVALGRVGIKVDNYYASEIDKYAIQIAKKNYPDTVHVGDVTELHGFDLPDIDLLIGGSPCQGFSFAGKQLNFDDPRSKLFFEFVRLIKECKPEYFLLENVRMKKEYQQVITEALGVEAILINSALVSAQNRNRLYWTNIAGVEQPEDKGIVLKDVLESGEGIIHENFSKSKTKHYTKSCALRAGASANYQTVFYIDSTRSRKITPLECERLQTLPDNYTEGVSNTQRYKMTGNGWTVDVIVHILENLYLLT